MSQSEDVADVLQRIRSLKDFSMYESFAYHISYLREFVVSAKAGHNRQGSKRGGLFSMDGSGSRHKHTTASVHGGNVWQSMRVRTRGLGDSSTRKGAVNAANAAFQDLSVKSTGGGMRRSNTATGSLHAMA